MSFVWHIGNETFRPLNATPSSPYWLLKSVDSSSAWGTRIDFFLGRSGFISWLSDHSQTVSSPQSYTSVLTSFLVLDTGGPFSTGLILLLANLPTVCPGLLQSFMLLLFGIRFEWLWGLNKIVHVKCLTQWLAHFKNSINGGYHNIIHWVENTP